MDREALGDPLPLGLSLCLIAVLIGVNGFFAASRYALTNVRSGRMDKMAAADSWRGKLALHVLSRTDAYAAACQLGVTAATIGIGWIGAQLAITYMAPWLHRLGVLSAAASEYAAGIAVFCMAAALLLVFGELAPKYGALRRAEATTIIVAAPLALFYRALTPIVWILNKVAYRMLKAAGIEPASERDAAHTEADLRELLKESHQNGHIDGTELALVDNIFHFTETTAREIMIPRMEMICLNKGLSLQANKAIAARYMRTRYPVCENDKDNIVGFIHIKDLLQEPLHAAQDIAPLIRPITTVPVSIPISSLLKLMQKKKSQIAILIDEYGGTSGLVTLEDIMEEIVGDIRDEFDPDIAGIVKLSDDVYSVSGFMLIEEVNSFFALALDTDDYDTIGGWLYSRVEFPPRRDQAARCGERIEFVVEETHLLRISRLLVKRIGDQEGTSASVAGSDVGNG